MAVNYKRKRGWIHTHLVSQYVHKYVLCRDSALTPDNPVDISSLWIQHAEALVNLLVLYAIQVYTVSIIGGGLIFISMILMPSHG